MNKFSKRGAIRDVDPADVIVLIKTAGKVIKDLMKKDNNKSLNNKK